MNTKKILAYSLVFSVLFALLADSVDAVNQPPNGISVSVNGTIDGKDVVKVVKKVVKEGGKVVKKVGKEGGKVIKKVGKEGKRVIKKVGKKLKKIFG